jgi:hypothetical protein
MLGSRVRLPQLVVTLNRSPVYIYVLQLQHNTAFCTGRGPDKCPGTSTPGVTAHTPYWVYKDIIQDQNVIIEVWQSRY